MTLYANGKPIGHFKEVKECVLPIKEVEANEKMKLVSDSVPFECTIEATKAFIERIQLKHMVDRLAWRTAQRKMRYIERGGVEYIGGENNDGN